MRYGVLTTVRVSDEWLSVCAICLHTGLNPKGHQAAYALPNLFAAHDNEEPRYKGQRRFANRASRRCGGSLPVVLSGAIHLFKPLSPGAKTATTVSASPGVKCTSRKTFCPEAGKNFCGLPGQSFPSVAVMPLAAKVLKKVMVNTGGNKRQVPAKRQNRGSRNSTDDGG